MKLMTKHWTDEGISTSSNVGATLLQRFHGKVPNLIY